MGAQGSTSGLGPSELGFDILGGRDSTIFATGMGGTHKIASFRVASVATGRRSIVNNPRSGWVFGPGATILQEDLHE